MIYKDVKSHIGILKPQGEKYIPTNISELKFIKSKIKHWYITGSDMDGVLASSDNMLYNYITFYKDNMLFYIDMNESDIRDLKIKEFI